MSVTNTQSHHSDTAPLGCGPVFPESDFERNSTRKQVFEYVRGNGSVSRSSIARALSISAGLVTGIAGELIADGLLQELESTDRAKTGRGRPPVDLSVVPSSFYVIGIHLSNKRHSAILTDSVGTILGEATQSARAAKRPMSTLIEEVRLLIDAVVQTTDIDIGQISAIGIGLAGLIDQTSGIVSWSPLLSEVDASLADCVAVQTGIPVFIDNDANVVTLAELWFGDGRAKTNFAVMTVENGVGMGFVLNNRLFRGARGMGMELGHTKVQVDGALCRCGQRGCLEAYLADYALLKDANSALGSLEALGKPMTLKDLSNAAQSGNPAAQEILENASNFLYQNLTDSLIPYWYGTAWDYNGISQKPGKGKIACGYFVFTLLRDAGFRLPRVKMSQAASEQAIKSLVNSKQINRYSNISLEEFITKMKTKGNGIYIVGLDNHVGLYQVKNEESWFLHSTVIYPSCVIKEKAAYSPALQYSSYRVVGKLSDYETLTKQWLLNEYINLK